MIGRTQDDERRTSQALLQRALSCISQSVIVAGRPVRDEPSFWTMAERYVPLGGRSRLEFSVLHAYAIRGGPLNQGRNMIGSVGYFYQLRERDGPEVIAFHWHPGRPNQPPFPHVHVQSRVGSVEISHRFHIPTGRVPIEAVVRFLITELDVQPRRDDWARVLDDGEQQFNARRSW